MKKNSLSEKGLSLSQAQSISNLCNQRGKEIDAKLEGINNVSKTVTYKGTEHVTVESKPIPTNVVELLVEKSSLHACQAFLMENIKAKDNLIKEVKKAVVDTTSIVFPERDQTVTPNRIPEVGEEWGWEQLTVDEVCDFQEAEAYAAHIGQFIHQDKVLDKLRRELPTISNIEWMIIKDGEKTPVIVKKHHTSEQLLSVHEELAALHREREQRVNYFKAKVKNLVTNENARIAKLNADAQNDAQKINNEIQANYTQALLKANEELRTIQAEFEKERQAEINEIAALKISVNKRFQKVVDMFLSKLGEE